MSFITAAEANDLWKSIFTVQVEQVRMRELLGAGRTFLSHFTDPEDALINGMDVEAWCAEVDKLLPPE